MTKNCKNFQNLTPLERMRMIGSIVHLLQVSTTCFNEVNGLIASGEEAGWFKHVLIANIDTEQPVLNKQELEDIEDFDGKREAEWLHDKDRMNDHFERDMNEKFY